MNCEQAIKYIHSLEKFGMKLGLQRVERLCKAVGDPQNKLKFIHVAGTNGKGSTSTMISNILIKSGYKTGLFISPYVTDFRERIQLNGEMISPECLAECVEIVKNAVDENENDRPTEFEVITVTALLFFAKMKCDFVVLEVGLGGRYDSTNIIPSALVNVIVSISLDHIAVLGETIDKIAYEKCGIIKKNSVTVSYPFQHEDAMNVIENSCSDVNSPLFVPDTDKLKITAEEFDGTTAEYDNIKFKLPLAGRHMIYNAITAIEAVKALETHGFLLEKENIAEGISVSVMPARLELIKKSPVILLDGGHNEGCAEAVSNYLKNYFADKRIVMLSSIMADKDADSFLRLVVSLSNEFIATKADVPRAMDTSKLKELAEKYCKNSVDISDPHEALKYAEERLKENDMLVVCGSFYLAGEIRKEMLEI